MNQKVFNRRVYISVLLLVIISVLFIVRLSTLHFSQKIILSENDGIEHHRGYIRDRNGSILALSIELNSLFANPGKIENRETAADQLSRVTGEQRDTLFRSLGKDRRFVWIRRKIDDDTVQRVKSLGIKGLGFRKEYRRVYPHGMLASNLLGFVGVDNTGLEGIEYRFNDILTGKAGGPQDRESGVVFGNSITLTIDSFIQKVSEIEIGRAVTENRARQGAVVVMDVHTGRILAMAKYPGYNPNYYHQYRPFFHRNFTVIDSFEPGSTMKIISLAAMLRARPGVMRETYNCEGSIDIADTTINCTGNHGQVTMPDVIRHSCNVGIISAMKNIPKKELYDTFVRFGFGKKTDADLPGESEGILRHYSTWSGLSKYSMAIGHEISVTSLQLAAAFAAIANGGIYNAPAIIESIDGHDGSLIYRFRPKMKGRVIDRGRAALLMKMMRGVVTEGTGRRASSRYYGVAGKTGTSQKFFRKGGYYSDRVVSSFIGVAPYNRPEVCVLVIIDEPEERYSGGRIAAPVFSRIIDRALPFCGVGNDRVKARGPARTRSAAPVKGIRTMPDFRGLRLPDAMRLVISIRGRYGIDYSIAGTGRVYAQNPAPGTALKNADKITLYFMETE